MSVDVVNAIFNEKLRGLTPSNADSVILSLGRPGGVLLAVGIEDKELRLYGNKLMKKIKKHGYKPCDIEDLPGAVNNPIAIFYGTHAGSYSILTELKIKDYNVVVSLEIGKDRDVNFNIITSTYGKTKENVICWINKGYLLYTDKEKTLNYLRIPALIAGATDSRESLILDYPGTPAPIAGALDNREPLIFDYPSTPAPIAGAVDNRGLANTCYPRTPASIAGAADGRELLEAIKTVAGFKNPVLTDKIIYLPENVNTQNTFSKKGGAHVCP